MDYRGSTSLFPSCRTSKTGDGITVMVHYPALVALWFDVTQADWIRLVWPFELEDPGIELIHVACSLV